MKRSSRVFGTPIYTNGIPAISMNGGNNIQVVDGTGSSVECLAFGVENASVNFLKVNATAAGSHPSIEAKGDDANLDVAVTPKGTGLVDLQAATDVSGELTLIGANKWIGAEAPGGDSFAVANFISVDNSVNVLSFTSAATGSFPGIAAQGTDTNVNLQLGGKGTGKVQATTDFQVDTDLIKGSLGDTVVEFIPQASAVNYIQIGNQATGNSPTIQATGTDADVDITLTPKGIGGVIANAELFAASNLVFQTAASEIWVESPATGGKAAIQLNSEDNAVNFLSITGTATGNPVAITPAGTDTDIDLDLETKGTGMIYATSDLVLDTGVLRDTNDNEALTFVATGSAVNHLQVTNAATGNDVILSAIGDDTDISLSLVGKGTGVVIAGGGEVIGADYAGIKISDNSSETTVPLTVSYVKVSTFSENLPNAISTGDHTRDEITVGTTGTYEVQFSLMGFSAGADKEWSFTVFEVGGTTSITAITQANPAVVTAEGHGLNNGDTVAIKNVAGMVEVNDRIFTVANVSGSTFELQDDDGTGINSSGFTAYSSAGTTQPAYEIMLYDKKFVVANNREMFSGSTFANLASGNFVQLYTENLTDATAFTFGDGTLTIRRIG